VHIILSFFCSQCRYELHGKLVRRGIEQRGNVSTPTPNSRLVLVAIWITLWMQDFKNNNPKMRYMGWVSDISPCGLWHTPDIFPPQGMIFPRHDAHIMRKKQCVQKHTNKHASVRRVRLML